MITIRRMKPEDVPEVYEIEKSLFSVPWSEASFREVTEKDRYVFFVASDLTRILGFAGMSVVDTEADITNVAVRKEEQRNGIGRALMKVLKGYARDHGIETVFLEVRASNDPAIALYESEGFRQVGQRKDYYESPREDALIYTLNLSEYEEPHCS
ncbi:MAG: ribosomal protein S18-alanine N-acetyltransferase [Lachnospiraceae bacterium]|nr:ribosomal protein S18-alanine N-acetyltransferase [Lachnospiraceae bacterium]